MLDVFVNVDFFQFKEDCNTEKKIASKLKDSTGKSLLLGSEAELRINLFDLLRVKHHKLSFSSMCVPCF